jgi:DNA-binding response OmpR family regulator
VVNDTQEILDMFRVLLEDEGYEVVLSSFPLQKISQVEHIKPDLIILDLLFGSENHGFQVLEMLKLSRSTAPIPVIICTAALQTVREMEGYLVSKGIAVVYKPFDIDELFITIRQALATSKSTMSHVNIENENKE